MNIKYTALLPLLIVACQTELAQEPAPIPKAPNYSVLSRVEFNRMSLESAMPLFWTEDKDQDSVLDANEVAVVWGYAAKAVDAYVASGEFTAKFAELYERYVAQRDAAIAAGDAREQALRKELAQSYFTSVEADFSTASAEDQAIVRNVLHAAEIIERVYAKQLGTWGLDAQLAGQSGVAQLVYFINQGPWCSGPQTETDPNCNALAPAPARVSGLYPASLQANKTFCDDLQKHIDAKALTNPFTVVTEQNGQLVGVPYTEAYKEELVAVSDALKAAAAAIQDPAEGAFKTYLLAAAQAFTDNTWYVADEAWSKMNAENSKWYLRIGPDEVYFEPCSLKAGFHVSFARINQGSLAWQRKLDPIKQEMENTLAKYAGAPYKARSVSFHLPDFIDIVLNAGDSRDARGATIGQSLPNWGPVANEGRGRTVAMTNFYTDAESKRILRAQTESMLCADTMAHYSEDAAPQLMSTVLHEAAHNLGPAHEYKVKGKTDDQIFGGPMASTLEELKAQTSALFFTDWLVTKNVITADEALRAHVRDITWGLGHISRGLYDAEGKAKPYSQLAAIQVGTLLKEGALVWAADATAGNGQDKGCLRVVNDKLAPAIDKLTTAVLRVKGGGDVKGAQALKAEFVDSKDLWAEIIAKTKERYQRFPRPSFLYAIKL